MSKKRPQPAKPNGARCAPGPLGGRFADVRERIATNEAERSGFFGDFPEAEYDAGRAVVVHPIGGVGAISVRSPLTKGRLQQLGEAGFEVVTRTPHRYPERAWVLRAGSWLEVEVVSADEDSKCEAAKHALPVTHVGGLERIPPHSFRELVAIGAACVTPAGEEPGEPEALGGGYFRARRSEAPARPFGSLAEAVDAKGGTK